MSKDKNRKLEVLAKFANIKRVCCRKSDKAPAINADFLKGYETEIEALERRGLVKRDKLTGSTERNVVAITDRGIQEFKQSGQSSPRGKKIYGI